MAFTKSYTDPYGVTHPNAYWRLTAWAFDLVMKCGKIEFSIYHDAAARNTPGIQPFPNRAGFSVNEQPIRAGTVGTPGDVIIPGIADVVDALDAHEDGCRAKIYLLAKGLPELADGVDC